MSRKLLPVNRLLTLYRKLRSTYKVAALLGVSAKTVSNRLADSGRRALRFDADRQGPEVEEVLAL